MFTCSTHTHSNLGSRDDGYATVKEIVAKTIELGGRAVCMTDHGTLVALQDYISECKDKNIKFIPGLEAYVKNEDILDTRRHLILLAKSYKGYEAISKIVTETAHNNEDGFPITTEEMLMRWIGPGAPGHGEVIGTSACMWGVANALILQNNKYQKEINKILKKQGERPDIERYNSILDAIEKNDTETKEMRIIRDRNRLKSGDKALFENTVARLEALKNETKVLKLERDELKGPVEKYNKYSDQIKEIEKSFVSDRVAKKQAKEELIKYRDIFGAENFYVELQYHGIEEEAKCMPVIASLAADLGLPVIAANDAHIVSPDQAEGRQMLFVNRYGWKELREDDKELYIKSDEELTEWLEKILPKKVVKEAVSNISVVVDRCNVEFPPAENHFPKFPCSEGGILRLRALIKKGKKKIENWNEEYQKRLSYELNVIESLGFSDYLCIVADFIEYGNIIGKLNLESEEFLEHRFDIDYLKKMSVNNVGVGIGPGRGSACGSLICYMVGITKIDPIPNGLLFERFLNKDRVSWPDIDTDVSVEARQFVIEYIKNKYGEKAVCQILTLGYFGAKSSIQAGCRCLGKKLGDDKMFTGLGLDMTKDIEDANASINNVEKGILEKFGNNSNVPEILRLAKLFEGKCSNYGTHAAGIVVSDNSDVSDYTPLIKVGDAIDCSCDLQYVEPQGMLKLDLLGLRNLSIITKTLKEIQKTTGQIIDINNLPEDPDVLREIFAAGRTNGVFQFESAGMKKTLMQFKPESISDLTLLNAIFRPGPLQYIDEVSAVKNKEKEATYIVPEMEEILGPTYGKPIYQEEIMAIFNKIAGFSLGESDIIRRYMSKKKVDKFMAYKDKFIEGLIASGATKTDAEGFWDELLSFSQYAFNKSHARAYAQVAYITAYLKYHFPAAYYVGLLNYTDNDKREAVLKDAVMSGVEIVTPDINLAESEFSLNQDMQIVYGLSYISMVAATASEIVRERKENGLYTGFVDFISRVKPRKNVLENLIKAGSFDSLVESREGLLAIAEEKQNALAKYEQWAEKLNEPDITEKRVMQIETKMADFEAVINEPIKLYDDNKLQSLIAEKDVIGSFISDHPVPKNTGYDKLSEFNDKASVVVFISRFETRISKSGNTYANLLIEDRSGSVEATMFSKAIVGKEDLLKDGNIVLASLVRKEDGSVIVNKVEPFKATLEIVKLPVSSYEKFIKNEKFLANYKGDKQLVLYDISAKHYIKTNYLVSRDILKSERFMG